MSKRRLFPAQAYAAGGDYSLQLNNVINERLGIKLDGLVTAAGGGGVAALTQDSPADLLGVIEIDKGPEPKIKMNAIDLYHLEALVNKKYSQKLSTTPGAGLTDNLLLSLEFPLNAFGLRAPVFLKASNLFIKGTFGALTDYAATNVAAIVATLRGASYTPQKAFKGGYLEPNWKSTTRDISTAATELSRSVEFSETVACVGLLLRQLDASGVGDARRPDGIVRKITINDNKDGQIFEGRWGEIVQITSKFFGIPLAELAHGIGFVPLLDARNKLGVRGYNKDDNIEVIANTSDAVEGEITAIAPAAGDTLVITPICFTYRNM